MKDLISVIVPSYQSGKFISSCLESIEKQSYQHYEIILVDAHSTDSTREIAAKFRNVSVLLQNDKAGLAAAWNIGIAASQGEYIAFLDSDDFWEPDCLLKHREQFEKIPGLDYSIGKLRYFLDAPNEIPYGFKPSLLLKEHVAYMPGCFLGKRELFFKIGQFDESLKVAMDIEWFYNLKMSQAKGHGLADCVLNKRVHRNNLSYTLAERQVYQNELLQVLHRRIAGI